MHIRHARSDDLAAIVAIYNAAIPGHQATADLAPVTVTERQAWLASHRSDTHPLWIAEADDGHVAGWVALSTFYRRPAWDPTVELSLYVHPDYQGSGVGRALAAHAIDGAAGCSIKSIIAIVFAHNEASLSLLESVGFERWGYLPRVTRMPEGRRDVVILGLETDARD
jgi:L-amino acid N-acyltransferase YncA